MQYPSYKLSFKNQFRTMASLTVYRTGRQQCPAGYSRGEEIRDFYLIHYVMHGKGMFYLNGKAFPVQQGQAFLIYPHMPINYVADSQDPWEFCWVGFNGADAAILMKETRFTPEMPVITLKDGEGFCALLLEIYRLRGELPHEILRMTAGLYQVISTLVEEVEAGVMEKSRPGIRHLQMACDYIAAHYAQDMTVEEVAATLGLCRSQLYRVFKEHAGMSPQRYLTEFRIREARGLILRGERSVKEIAYAVGFRDPLYFSHVFKAYVGRTPSRFIEENRKRDEERP